MGLLEGGMFEDLKEEHRKDSGLTREDIERLTVDENLSDLQRTQLFLSANAHQLQQSCAFERLPTIFHDYGATAYDTLFPALAISIEHFNPHIQVSAGKAFALIMQDPDLPKDMAMWLLPMTLRMVNLNQILEVLQAWIEVLCVLVPKLPMKVVKEDLLQLALARGKVEETVSSRVVCSRLLGAIAPILDQQEIEHSFLSKAMALCQDTDAEVRICMCNQLNAISHAVGSEIMKKTVLPELYELLKDEEAAVHSAALTSLVEMLDSLPSDVKRLKILPVLHSLCGQNDAKMLLPLAHLFGDLILKMAPDLSEEDIQLFIDSYKSLSRHSSEEVRQLCAYNFPAVLKSIGGRKYAMTLHLTYQQLVQDPSTRVRHNVSAGFHEVSKILGKERTATYLKEAFLSLLNDNSREVQRALISTLQQVIGQFSVANEQQRMSIYTSMLPHLLQAEKDIVPLNMWRLQTALLETFALLVEFLTSDQIFEHLVPLCFHYMTESVLPVRSAAAITLAIFVRNNHHAMQRYELAQTVVREFGHGRSYWARLVYVDFCEKFLSISSTHFFKEHFLEAAILILQDEVIGVRIRACALLPLLKSVVKLPEDTTFLERINFCATQRLNDNDKQVAAAARAVADAFKHLSIRCMGVEPGNENYAMQVEFETVDKQREEEEWNMLGKEEQEEQRKLDEMIQKMKTDKRYASAVGNPVVAAAAETEGGARKTIKAAEKGATFPPVRSPAIAKLKSTVHQIASLHSGSSGVQSGATASQAKLVGLSPAGSATTATNLSRSPSIVRSQATITSGLGRSVNLQQQQQGVVTPLAPSLISRSTTVAAPSQLKSASASLEPNEPATVGSGSNPPPPKAISKPSFRAARRSS